jgi:DNA-directed RNA polymerase specialized sigma24 family protein
MRHIHQAAEDLNQELGDWPGQVPASWEEPDPEEQVEQVLILEALGELVGRLPERSRRVVVARYGLGKSVANLATGPQVRPTRGSPGHTTMPMSRRFPFSSPRCGRPVR